MTRASGTRAVVTMITLFALTVLTGSAQAPKYAGRPLADVLHDLQAQGLKLLYSSELVRPDMMVMSEPRASTPRKALDAVLKPLGLEARDGPAGTVLIVRARRPPLASAVTAPASATVDGTVVDARTGAALSDVVIGVQGRDGFVVSDATGAFSLKLPAGRHVLFVSLVGYSLARPSVDLRDGATVRLRVPLADGTTTYAERVTVTGDPFHTPTAAAPVERTMTNAELQKLRGLLTDDPFRAVQSLPGVATTNDTRSEFSIRGSDFRHMGLSVDGLPTPWLVHNVRNYETKGSIALLNADVIIDSALLSAGAQPQVQPGRMGAWLDLRIREGSRERPRTFTAR
jgi:hypothetical protein